MKNISYILLISLLMFGACTGNFDDLAKNPNTAEEVIPSMLFTNAALSVAQPSYGKTFFTNPMFSKQIVWTETFQDVQYYYLNQSGFGSYSTLRNVQKMKQEAERTEEEVYIGLAHFFNAWFIYDLTLTFGDIPYSDALMGETDGLYSPKYDLQEDVFIGILEELEMANTILENSTDVLIGDVIYNGDISKWRRAANTFALKVLVSLSERAGDSKINVAQKFSQIVSNPAKYPIFRSIDDNLQLEFRDKAGERYPFWNSAHSIYPHFDKSFLEILKKFQDKRLFYYAAPAVKLIDEGLTPDNFDTYEGGDGTDEFEILAALGSGKEISRVHARYYEDPENEPYISLGYSELQFNLAEGALRGWTNGSAESHYNEGIKSSIEFVRTYGVSYDNISMTDSWINEYITSSEVAYDESNALEQIITQKYISTFLNTGWNTYYENRRTGYPVFKVNPVTSLNEGYENQVPTRWRYPQKELDYNTDNVEEAIKRQFGEDIVNAKMWLIK